MSGSSILAAAVAVHPVQANISALFRMMPTGEPVPPGDHKLVFVEHNGQHYLREVWDSNGRQIVTTQLRLFPAAGDKVTEIHLVEQESNGSGGVKAAEFKSALQ